MAEEKIHIDVLTLDSVRLDVGHADAVAIAQVGQLDRLDRADLHTLAALDAGGQKVAFVELGVFQGAGWAQAVGALLGHHGLLPTPAEVSSDADRL